MMMLVMVFQVMDLKANNSIIEPLIEDFGNYIIQIIDPETLDVQFTELVTLTTER